MSASASPTRAAGAMAQWWRPAARTAALVIWGLWAVGSAAGPAWAAPAGGHLSCGAAGAQPSRAGTFHAGGAQITLNTSQGTAGTKLLVHGAGWPAQAPIQVDEEINGQGIFGSFGVTAVAATDGTFEAPAFAAAWATCGFDPSSGLVAQIVARTVDQQVSASAPFTYVAPPTLARGFADNSVAASAPSAPVAGANWDAGVVVTLWTSPQGATPYMQDPWQPPAGAPTTSVRADADGNITADVPLATGQRPGTWIVVSALATSARYGELTMTLGPILLRPTVMPALRLDRAQGLAGSSVTVSGSQYWPGDTVTIAYCRGAPQFGSSPIVQCNQYLTQVLGQATVGSAGSFTARVTLPRNARTGLITFEAYATTPVAAMGDPYTLTTPFHIVAPAQTGWHAFATVHPRLAQAVIVLVRGTGLVLVLYGLAWSVWWFTTRRGRALRRR